MHYVTQGVMPQDVRVVVFAGAVGVIYKIIGLFCKKALQKRPIF